MASKGSSQKFTTNFKIPLKIRSEGCGYENSSENDRFLSPLAASDAEQPENAKQPEPSDDQEAPIKRKLEQAKLTICGRDKDYPQELNNFFQPLQCNLCNVSLNSTKTERAHYESKHHYKKVTNWLKEWSARTGEPLPKIQKLFRDGPTGEGAFYCEHCDLKLTSSLHASQHYNGKRHKMVIANIAKPSGHGHYNTEGKWIRQDSHVKHTNRRFGIGEAFVKQEETVVSEPKIVPRKESDKSVECDVCKITLSSAQQLQAHLSGTKHGKKLKALGAAPYAPSGDTVLASLKKNPKADVSIYRTPSGNFYCHTCNVSLSEEIIFKNHLDSKRHIKNLKPETAADDK